MPRGVAAKDGDTNVSANGYHYTRQNGKFRLTHHIIAEEKLGRPINTETEVVRFKDKDKTNLSPDNIEAIPKGTTSVRARLARVEAQIAELTAQRDLLLAELGKERP
jgi:hypothetical protein